MTNAIVPVNIAAVRVNQNDASQVVENFQGRTAVFEKMPWADPMNSYANAASTGDKIFKPLGVASGGGPLHSPMNSLNAGIHLHWELPAHFKKGKQVQGNPKIVFPHAPNRWLVTRNLSIYDAATDNYGATTSRSWVVESDYVTTNRPTDGRVAIPVPLPAAPGFTEQPYRYMGRVVRVEDWDPDEPASDYLPSYQGLDNEYLYLSAIGFVGPYFSSYYPECSSVFGFWDNFDDVSDVQQAIATNVPMQFRASYQVAGWFNDETTDPLYDIVKQVTTQYDQYIQACDANSATPDPAMSPAYFFGQIMSDDMHWTLNLDEISYTIGDASEDYKIEALEVPTRTICAGTVQEIVWDMLSDPGTKFFLSSSGEATSPGSVWTAPTEIAIGNSTEEALSALLKVDMGQTDEPQNVDENDEYLLDALQLGLLKDLENNPNQLISLEESLHSNGFESLSGGLLWSIVDAAKNSGEPSGEDEVTLPLNLAEQLHLLNAAQKSYDMGRSSVITRRKQLFMDWTRYVKMFQGETTDPYLDQNTMNNFIYTSSGGELNEVIAFGNSVGVLQYVIDETTGETTGIAEPGASVAPDSLAYDVWSAYQTMLAALAEASADLVGDGETPVNLQLQVGKAESFMMPTAPVLLMEGPMMEPPQRSGDGKTTFVRQTAEILSKLKIEFDSAAFEVEVSAVQGVPVVTKNLPAALQCDVQALAGEAFLLTPMLAPAVATTLAAAGGTNNPATKSAEDFAASLMHAQGGLNPLDILPNAGGISGPTQGGLYEAIRAADYERAANPSSSAASPQPIDVTFTNASANGWVTSPTGWNAQQQISGFPTGRVDPFLPAMLIWKVDMQPLQWQGDASSKTYSSTNLTSFFELDPDGVDYVYRMDGGAALPFASPTAVSYQGDATMRSQATGVLTYQIDTYIANNPTDPEDSTLEQIAAVYADRKILAQAMSGFDMNQVLSAYVAQVAVENLVAGKQDSITKKVDAAAGATPDDNWYDDAFNSLDPIPTGLQALGNFGPLRAGFMDLVSVEIVDAFGQRMNLMTAELTSRGALSCITSYALTPNSEDTANAGRIYLPPRLLTPSRVWFKWLSATHNNEVTGVDSDFVESNSHPATAPICGWIMPNHLDNDLFFYDADGSAIGTFGVEHGALVYRTRAGNLTNTGTPEQQLTGDIGAAGSPTCNPHTANLMWYLFGRTAAFLEDLMTVVQDSDTFIQPSTGGQDNSLAVLVGRPLAITRAMLGIETSGNLLPLSQADTDKDSPFPQDVVNGRTVYEDRMKFSSANLGAVDFPVRLGELANLDDGLVGYIIEASGADPYVNQTLFAPAANASWKNGVEQPTPETLRLTLNEAAVPITVLVDPRAGVHATTGVLAVNEISIPSDQYTAILNNLAVNFVTRPMLDMAQGLQIPLPAEKGYMWAWITPGATAETPLKTNDVNQIPVYGYTPQQLLEGWLALNALASSQEESS